MESHSRLGGADSDATRPLRRIVVTAGLVAGWTDLDLGGDLRRGVPHPGADDAVRPTDVVARIRSVVRHGPRSIPPPGRAPNMRLRRSELRGPGLRRVRRGRGLLLPRPRRRAGHRCRDPATHQGSCHPAGLEEGLDLRPSQRTHSGSRNGRRRPTPVPLSPEVAGRAERGEVRPGAGDVGRDFPICGNRSRRTCAAGGLPATG